MKSKEWSLAFVTPCFSGGIDARRNASLRAPSIRGMLRFWHRALGADKKREFQLFGGIRTDLAKSEPHASAVLVRASCARPTAQARKSVLPHKKGDGRFDRPCIPAETRFKVQMVLRPGRADRELEEAALVMEVFSLLGALGFRGNRGAGSLWPVDPSRPATAAQLEARLSSLKARASEYGLWGPQSLLARAYIDLYPNPLPTSEGARELCTDTVRDSSGKLGYTGLKGRLSSPLKFKVIELGQETGGRYWILRVGFPGRYHADAGLRLLQQKGKRIGQLPGRRLSIR
ncbi:MAG: hypothetical protein Kow001_05420 [Acidobacteriota bacterium]